MNFTEKVLKIGRFILALGWIYYLVNLPFQWVYLPTALGMMIAGLGWLILMAFSKGKLQWTQVTSGAFRYLFLFYLLGLLLHLGDAEPKISSKIIGIQTPLWVWPLMLALQRGDNPFFDLKHARKLFLWSVSASAFVALLYIAYYQWLISNPLGYRHLSPFEFIPVHYLAMLYAFAYLWTLNRAFKQQKPTYYLFSILFLLAVIFLNVRIQWLVVIIGTLLLLLFSRNVVNSRGFYILGAMIVLFLLMLALPESRRRIVESKDEMMSGLGIKTDKQTNHRVYIWQYSWQVIREKPWLGHKPGHADKALQAAYQDCEAPFWDGEGVYYLRDRNYNHHNTYMQSWADRGIIGFALILLAVLLPMFSGRVELALLCGVMGAGFITESMLDRQAGVFFFAFLLPLFSYGKRRNPADQ